MKTKSKITIIILLIIILNISLRIFILPHEVGEDSFLVHFLSNSLDKNHYSRWMMSPLSLLGLYPYSYAGGIPFLLAAISSATDINLESVILIISTFLVIAGSLGAYIFVKEYTKKETFAILGMFLFSMNPLFLLLTTWTITTRAPFVALLPFLLYAILKYENTTKLKFLCLSILLILVESLIHRIILFVIAVILPSYFLAKFIYNKGRKLQFVQKYLYLVIIFCFLLFFIVQFSNIAVYKSQKWTYHSGFFFTAGNEDSYRSGSLKPILLLLNMLIDYLSKLGLFIILTLVSVVLLMNRIRRNTYEWKELFVVLILMITTPLLIIGIYTPVFSMPLFVLLSVLGCFLIINFFSSNFVKYMIIVSVVTISVLFSIFMFFHSMQIGSQINEKEWIGESTLSAESFINSIDIDNSSILTSNPGLNQKLRAFSDAPLMPANTGQDIGLLIYGIPSINTLQTDFVFDNISLSPKSLLKFNINNVNTRQDWDSLLSTNLGTPENTKILNVYKVSFILEKKKDPYISSNWRFYNDIKATKPKIFDNNFIEIWYLK